MRPFLVSTQSHVLEEKGRLFEDAKRVRAGAMSRRHRIICGGQSQSEMADLAKL